VKALAQTTARSCLAPLGGTDECVRPYIPRVTLSRQCTLPLGLFWNGVHQVAKRLEDREANQGLGRFRFIEHGKFSGFPARCRGQSGRQIRHGFETECAKFGELMRSRFSLSQERRLSHQAEDAGFGSGPSAELGCEFFLLLLLYRGLLQISARQQLEIVTRGRIGWQSIDQQIKGRELIGMARQLWARRAKARCEASCMLAQ